MKPQNREAEKLHMEKLAAAMRCRVTRDECGDYTIQGRRGDIHADGTGYSVFVQATGSLAWKNAKLRLAGFCDLRQDGDWEGVLHLRAVPTTTWAWVLRRAIRARRIPAVTPEALERLAKFGATHRFAPGASGAGENARKMGKKRAENGKTCPDRGADENEKPGS